jgi:hypothetical protein
MYLHTNGKPTSFKGVPMNQKKPRRGLTPLQKRILGASLSLLFLLAIEWLLMKLIFAHA